MAQTIFDDRQLEAQEASLQKKLRMTKKQRKAERKRQRAAPKTTIDLLPFRYIKNENCFVMKQGVTDYVQISGIRIDDLTPIDKQMAINQFHNFLKQYDDPFNLIYQTFPADTIAPLHFLNHKIRKNKNPLFQNFLSHRRWELEEAARSILHQEFYFQIFAKDEQELTILRKRLLKVRESYFKIDPIPFEKKMKILFKLNNQNTEVLTEVAPMTFYPDEAPAKGFDPVFLSYIQPRGGFHPRRRYIEKGDGFETCVHIVEYKRDARPFWGQGLFNQPNVVTVQSSRTITRDKVIKAVNDSSAEQENRFDTARNKTDQKMAAKEYQALDKLADEVVDTQETVKELHTRLYIYADTKAQLEDEVARVLGDLTVRGFRGVIQLSELESDYHALFTNYNTQHKEVPRHGQEIKSRSLAAGYAFDFSFLIDKDGLYYGNTTTDGAFIFSHTHKDADRMSYNMLICGVPGSGKSTALKKIALSRVILGEQVFIFAVSAEFNLLCRELGGVAENIAQSASNILQVFGTCVDEESLEILVDESFDAHLDKVQLIYRFLMNETVPMLERELQTHLRAFYSEWSDRHQLSFKNITKWGATQYPIFSDFLAFLQRQLYQNIQTRDIHSHLNEGERASLERLISNIKSIVQNDPLFNQHTKASNIEDAPIVVYNIETMLKKSRGKLNAQLFNCLNVFWDIMIRKGQQEKGRHDRGEAGEMDYLFRTLILDEFHNWTRSAYPEQLELLDRLSREARKYFAALIIASHHFHDILPKAAEKGHQNEIDQAMNNIFEATTYKVFMKQSSSSVEEIRKWYGKEFSDSELTQIPYLRTGHTIMNIAGKQNIHFKWDLSKKEDKLFSGGR
ncbi:VirB4 family type IV secretion system protein [Listeria booriae]|uniref:VirB4 family type IV secretion system protein n=1 Tax=Listeria booriae TaxID=1552123 RepID=UPI001E36A23E|nr:hypothetical protein [Listeria booriae]MCD2208589.1 hypothetical protein [Listeria booriae]